MSSVGYNTFHNSTATMEDNGEIELDKKPPIDAQPAVITNHDISPDHVTSNSSQTADEKTIPGSSSDGDTNDIAEDLRCGLGRCKSDCLQVFNNPKAILACLCWFGFIQGFMVNGVNNVNTSTMERRFQLTSSKAGIISSSYDISAALFVIPISYYGAHAHQPRMLTMAAVIMALGAFVMSVPHFATGLYELSANQADQCHIGSNSTMDCDESGSSLSLWLGVLVVGMILIGIGGTTLYSIGIVFLDSSVSTESSPLYQGFLACSATLGPAVGYLLGGYFLQAYYVDFDKVDISDTDLTNKDPRFIGAWWLGFLAGGVLLVTVILLLMCYPRELPAAKKARQKYVMQVHQTSGNEAAYRAGFGTRWRDMPAALKVLFRNPVYVCNNLAAVCDGMLVSSFATFMTKLLQNQFSLTAGTAATYAGLASIPGAAGGQIVGAVICRLAKLNVREMLQMTIGLSVAAAAVLALLFMRCSAPHISGVNVKYLETDLILSNVDLESTCNAECGCTTLSYEPICDTNQIQYFSPCHAGCQTLYHSNNTKSYVNCSCISQSVINPGVAMATEGSCDVDCTYLNGFLVMFFVSILLIFLAAVPTLTITLRCIPPSQRSFGIGIQWVFVRLLGTIPGPIMMGAVFDSTCMVWQETCGDRGSCWVYNSKQLSVRVFIMAVVVKSACVMFFSMALCFYKAPPGECHEKNVSLSENTDVTTDSAMAAPSEEHNGSRDEKTSVQ